MFTGDGHTVLFWNIIYWASPPSGFGPANDSYARGLSVLFDENNVAVKKHYSEHAFRTSFGSGSVSIGRLIDDQTLARIKPNLTTTAQAIIILGTPVMESLALDGQLVFDWAYESGNFIAGRNQLRMLRVFTDPSGMVTAVRVVNDR